MKKFVLAGLLIVSGFAYADHNDYYDRDRDYARVISREPRYTTVQQQVCQQGSVTRSNQGRDTAIGAGVGAVTGTAIAGRHDKLLGAVVGGVAGAVIGSEVGQDSTTTTPTQVCHIEQQTVRAGDIVTFEYRGVRFTQVFGQ
jgi:uncharacterized protein YcfJ